TSKCFETSPAGKINVFSVGTALPTKISSLSLHDALPTWSRTRGCGSPSSRSPRSAQIDCTSPAFVSNTPAPVALPSTTVNGQVRSEEHTSELQSREKLVCRRLLEKKNIKSRRSKYSTSQS